MKKVINFVMAALVFFAAVSCGTIKSAPIRDYSEEGTGFSMKKDIAFNMAVANALEKISNEHGVSIESYSKKSYSTFEKSHNGRPSEVFEYKTDGETKTKSMINDYRVVERKYSYDTRNQQWVCTVKVVVSYENVN